MKKKNAEIEIAVAEVVDYMRIMGGFQPALNEVVKRKVASNAAKQMGVRVSSAELQKAADSFRLLNGLVSARDTENWLKANGVTVETFEDFIETNILVNKLKDRIEKKADRRKYAASPAIQSSIREMAFQDWVTNALK
ncbi:MAG: SurA N-terminal domain-containing protein [Nitrospirae bacterium]|nr:SurA N-terminal domain-containing protein [Nitrospirota bacterium]